MTNRVDLFQPERSELAVPAGAAFAFIEGRLCPYLEVVEIVQAGRLDFGMARMMYNPAGDSEYRELTVEEIEGEIGTARPVSIRWIYNNLYPAGGSDGILIFAGYVEGIETTIGPDGEVIEVIARDYSATLERITVFGRQVRDTDGRTVFIEGAQTVFNEGGQPNASSEMVEHKGNVVRLFAANAPGAKLWDCADVILYLLCEYLPTGELALPDEKRLRAIAAGESVRDLDVTRLNLLDALGRCCEQAGLEFKFVPRLCESGPGQAIVFYRRGCGRSVELNLQQSGERLSISKTNVWKVTGSRSSPVTHRWTGQGDYKIFEATFDLVKAWRPEDESDDYDEFSPSTNPDFYMVKDVFRKWCLNEAGDYTGEPFNQGHAYDFSSVFETGKYVHRRRRFWPALSCDLQGKSLGYFLEVSYDSGETWWQYLHAFNNLLDECGIWLSSDRLDIETWAAAIQGTLRFRITASVASDERLSCTVADGPVGSAVPVVERVIVEPSRFKFRKVTGKSIFAGVQDGSVGSPDEADDSAALCQFIRRRAQAGAAAIETFDVRTPYLGLGFEVGDIVKTSPDDRDIFSAASDNRSTSVIERVRMDFVKQATRLKVVRSR